MANKKTALKRAKQEAVKKLMMEAGCGEEAAKAALRGGPEAVAALLAGDIDSPLLKAG